MKEEPALQYRKDKAMNEKTTVGSRIFGTDAPWQSPAEVLAAFLNLPLKEEERRAACYETAKELFSA